MWHPVEQLSPAGKERESHDRKALEDLFSLILTCQQDVIVVFFVCSPRLSTVQMLNLARFGGPSGSTC